jgi:histidyl-tRNA synthetase
LKLILGHKEAVENAIMVREVATNSQETIPLEDLTGYLKRRKLSTARGAVAA